MITSKQTLPTSIEDYIRDNLDENARFMLATSEGSTTTVIAFAFDPISKKFVSQGITVGDDNEPIVLVTPNAVAQAEAAMRRERGGLN